MISRSRVYRVTGTHDDFLTRDRRRELKWYGHIARSQGLAARSSASVRSPDPTSRGRPCVQRQTYAPRETLRPERPNVPRETQS
ncbi:hypothetical protein PoB_003962600 [Plakobranchus ocellatus]|uniref:Uncharacterized protein n=1 Tax=Plakobranchus ocellatus TaxID=259542 RepID=A0AAV4APM4_9GAST|nr:hypothetical protein PoB_003962600 [Plakobranchus ocellatus]